jgi:hypothetical protein
MDRPNDYSPQAKVLRFSRIDKNNIRQVSLFNIKRRERSVRNCVACRSSISTCPRPWKIIRKHPPKVGVVGALTSFDRQEVGRAGRDGLPSTCILFLCAEDVPVLEGFARGDTCSKTSLGLWLGGVMLTKLDPDGALSFNLYEQGRDYDIRVGVII